jgi:hypothetical protein
MARVSKERTKEIRDQLKKEFPNLKLSVTMKDYCEIRVAIMAGNIDFSSFLIEEGSCYNAENFAYSVREAKKGYLQINHRYLNEWTGVAKDILTKITEIGAKGSYNRNANDPTADYCNMTFYFHLSLGQWNKPYIHTPKAEVIENKKEEPKVQEVIEVKEPIQQTLIELTLSEISATLKSDFSNEDKINLIQCKIAELKRANLKLVV